MNIKFLILCRLLNFKLDHSSVRIFEGVDYKEKKKERELELRSLMFTEVSTQQSRRRKVCEKSSSDY